ncbi:MAG TPA: hypothetical protein VIG45_06790 [Erysipelothrix sp.]
MSKYDWSNVPKEVNWIATDADGWKSMHEVRPNNEFNGWVDSTDIGYYMLMIPELNNYKGSWKDSLEERPK